jgi:hypothetical protein
MSGVVNDTHQEFWRPPAVVSHEIQPTASPVMAGACDGCGTEFMVGGRFCHVCGSTRQLHANSPLARNWTRYLEFHAIKQAVGLSAASLIAFLLGLGCLLAAVAVGMIFSIQTFNDFQAVQLFRLQWLLAAVAALLAGILLKQAGSERK